MKRITIAFLLLFVLSQSYAQDLVILHTNDTHSQILPQTAGPGAGLAGYQRREAFIKKTKAEHKNVILMDAGDFSQGTPYFTIFKGDVEIELMNALGYDIVCLGNHEFDNGIDELSRRISNAKFSVVCSNYDFSACSLNSKVKPYEIIKCDKYKIGVIGVHTDISSLVSPKNIAGLVYREPYKIVDSLAKVLKYDEKCNLVILLSHLGYDGGSEHAPSDDMLAKVTENIDVIIGGHTHTYLKNKTIVKNKKGKDVIIVTAQERGNYVGKLEFWF